MNRGVDGTTITREVTFPSGCSDQLYKVANIVTALDPDIYCEVYHGSDRSSISFTTYETLDGFKEKY